ncbi:hypothetical protein [Actinocorallia populi]|uniref:hypothetical protein n=1 Tax=Actinocorallia populi TaxID=2079200 RepID=UPI001300376B|nr:hypothetical protein [Actinocorallia populi]
MAVLAVVALGLLGGGIYPPVAKGIASASAADDRDAILQAARQVGLNLMSMDHKTIEQDTQRVLSGSTGTFKDQYAAQTKTFIEEITKNQATSQAQVLGAGVTDYDDDSAEVIVAVSAVVTSPSVPNGTPRNMRFLIEMSKVDGKWLASKFGVIQ